MLFRSCSTGLAGVADEQLRAQRLAQDRVECPVVDMPASPVEQLVGEVAEPRREAVTQDRAESKNLVGVAMGICVVLLDRRGILVEQTIQHEAGFAQLAVDNVDPELGSLVAEVAVHSETAAAAEDVRQVTCIQRRGGDAEAQTVRGGGGALAEGLGEGQALVEVDEGSDGGAQRFLAEVPVGDPRELADWDPGGQNLALSAASSIRPLASPAQDAGSVRETGRRSGAHGSVRGYVGLRWRKRGRRAAWCARPATLRGTMPMGFERLARRLTVLDSGRR